MSALLGDFGKALEAMRAGERVSRAGWNGRGMWLALVKADQWSFFLPGDGLNDERWGAAFIVMKTADNKYVPWLASQTDLLAHDWLFE